MELMNKNRAKLSDQIRQAVDRCGLTRYRICKELGIAESLMSRFMSGKGWLGKGTLDVLADLLDLNITTGTGRKRKGR